MASQPLTSSPAALDLSRWRKAPVIAIVAGLVFLGLGALVAGRNGFDVLLKQFGFSWLLGFMFFLSISLGGMFLVLAHHLFDASWSVPIGPAKIRFSGAVTHAPRARVWICVALTPSAVVKSKVSSVFTSGKRASWSRWRITDSCREACSALRTSCK